MWSLWCHLQLEFGRQSTPPIAVWAPLLLMWMEQLSLSLTWGWRHTCQEMTWVQQVATARVLVPELLGFWVAWSADEIFLSLVTESVCMADQARTTTPPPTSTTPTPTTTIAPPPTPPSTPERGSYTVNNSSGTVCLLAQMGLQLNVSYFSRSQNKV